MKLPEKFKGNPDFLTSEQSKINQIIDYLTELEKENKDCTYQYNQTLNELKELLPKN